MSSFVLKLVIIFYSWVDLKPSTPFFENKPENIISKNLFEIFFSKTIISITLLNSGLVSEYLLKSQVYIAPSKPFQKQTVITWNLI